MFFVCPVAVHSILFLETLRLWLVRVTFSQVFDLFLTFARLLSVSPRLDELLGHSSSDTEHMLDFEAIEEDPAHFHTFTSAKVVSGNSQLATPGSKPCHLIARRCHL